MSSETNTGGLKLFMVLLGCKPKGRLTEQHDIFFGIAETLKELLPYMNASWPEAKGNIHIDAWREVTTVNGHQVRVISKDEKLQKPGPPEKLFFLNLGGYKVEEFDEFHFKVLAIAADSGAAILQAKQTTFYKHMGFKGATSHIDDKYGVDIDDVYNVSEILHPFFKERYSLEITQQSERIEDVMHPGYLSIKKLYSL